MVGRVVRVESQDATTCFVEIECEALEDATATDLPFEHVALNRAAGSRLNLICAGGSQVKVGAKVNVAVRPLER